MSIIDNIYLCGKDPYKAKYQYLISMKKRFRKSERSKGFYVM